MSMPSGGVSTNDPKPMAAMAAAEVPQPAPRRGLASLQSMVISMVVILAAVLAWVAMVPRVREVSQPAVDVTSVATQVRRESGWAISVPRLPTGWKATSVRFGPAEAGVRTWHAGYLSPEGHYVSFDQTATTGASASWIAGLTANGQAEGALSAAGGTWRKFSSRSTVQRSLVFPGSATRSGSSNAADRSANGPTTTNTLGVATVLSGTAPYAQLAHFAETLELVKAEPAKPTS